MEHIPRLQKARDIVFRSLLVVMGISMAKIFFGLMYNSASLLADGLHSFIDSIIIILVMIALIFLSKAPSERFPYGYYKVEDLIVLILSSLFLLISITLIFDSIPPILRGEQITVNPIAAIVAFITGVISYTIGKMQERVAKRTNVLSLLLNSKEMKYDSIASWFVALSIMSGNYINFPMDRLASIIVALLIIRIAIISSKEAILGLLDAWNRPQIVEKIREILLSKPKIKDVRMIRLRKAGSLVFGDVIMLVDESLNIKEAHSLADEVENEIKEKIPEISEIIIHIEPKEKSIRRIAIPTYLSENGEMLVSEHFGRAKFLTIIEIDAQKQTYKIIETIINPFAKEKDKAGMKTVKLLVSKNIDAVITRNIGETSFYLHKGREIKVYQANETNIKDIVRGFLKGKFRELSAPTKQHD